MINSLTEMDTFIKIIVGSITGIATFLGLPLIYLNYKKTQAEIKKLDLESKVINNEISERNMDNTLSNDIVINIKESPNANVKILADPRFIAPLILLIDFIFAWVILTLSTHFFSIFGLYEIGDIIYIAIAFILLFPILKQSIKVKNSLKPNMSKEEKELSKKNIKMIIYIIFWILIASSFAFVLLIVFTGSGLEHITKLGYIITWTIGIFGVITLISFLIGKNKIDKKIDNLFDEKV